MILDLCGLSEIKLLLRATDKHSDVTEALMMLLQVKRQLLEYQGAWLYRLAKHYQGKVNILEIGTFMGYSAALMAMAAPRASITTLNPAAGEVIQARRNLAKWPNVKVLPVASWDYFTTKAPRSQENDEELYDMIFVDGDHRHIERDLPWFNRLKVGGLMLFHDYSPADASHPCPPVYEALNRMAEKLHGFDVLIIDDGKTGMAGICRREGEAW